LLSHITPLSSSAPPTFFIQSYPTLQYLHSFPTRRSSDLTERNTRQLDRIAVFALFRRRFNRIDFFPGDDVDSIEATSSPGKKSIDRKSTRLNSSHVAISYAVFCLKKKKKKKQ